MAKRRRPRDRDDDRDDIEVEGDPDPTDATPEKHRAKRASHEVGFTDVELAKLAAEFSDAIETELSWRESREQDWLRWHRVYNATPRSATKSYPFDSASNIVVPLSQIYVNVLVARQMQMLFSVTPHWTATELNKQYAPHTKPLERWLDWTRKFAWNQKRVVKPLVQETVKLGTSCLYNGWCDEQKFRYDEVKRRTVPAVRRYGPDPRWVPRADIICPQGYTDIQAAPYFAHRVWYSLERLRQLESSDYFENLDEAIAAGPADIPTYAAELYRRSSPDVMQPDDRFGLYDFWIVWLTRDFDGDGWPEEYVMTLRPKTRTIVRLRANPLPSQTRPYVLTRFIEREGEFDGMGISEQVEQLQDEASTIHNQRRDRAHLSNIVMWIAGAGAQGLGESIRPKSGRVLKVLDVNQIKEFRPSSNVQIDAYEEQVVTMLTDRLVGVSELSEGKVSSPIGRAAASTVMAMMQEGARRFDFNTSEMRDALSEQAHQVAELYQTYDLPEPTAHGSPEAVLDENDASLVRQLFQIKDNLRQFMAIDLNASTQAVNREVEKQANMQLYEFVVKHAMGVMQLATGVVNPQMPPQLREIVSRLITSWDRAAERVIQSFQAYELDDVLVGEVFAQMQPQAPPALGGPGAVGAPGGDLAAALGGMPGGAPANGAGAGGVGGVA